MIIPGSELVNKESDEKSIDKILKAAGFDWHEPGCSMCLVMNPDKLTP
jgi:3-isopropylmalate/(R)-2-methylmalate dehydratase large subunit